MAKPPVTPPGSIPNDDPKKRAYLKHMAIFILDQEEEDRLKVRKKGNDTRAADDGVDVKRLKDKIKKIKKQTPAEIADDMRKDLEVYGFMSVEIGTQFALFGSKVETTVKRLDYYQVGLLAAMNGKEGAPPQNLNQEDSQRWIAGWNDGIAYRLGAQEQRAQLDAVMDDSSPDAGTDDQINLEEAIDKSKLLILDLKKDFGDQAEIEDIELDDLPPEDVEKADRIELHDNTTEPPTVRVLKQIEGEKGSDFDEASPEELKKQGSRRALQAKKDGTTT